MTLYPKLILDALATVRYPGTVFWSFWINQARLQIPRKSLLQRMNFRINWMML